MNNQFYRVIYFLSTGFLGTWVLSWNSVSLAQFPDTRISTPLSFIAINKTVVGEQTEGSFCVHCNKTNKTNKSSNADLSLRTMLGSPKLLAQTLRPVPPRVLDPTRPANLLLPDTQPVPTSTPILNSPTLVPSSPSPVTETTVQVKRFEVLGSTTFSSKELTEAVAPFVNKKLTFEQLLGIRTAITNLYVKNGYTTSGAFLPPQDLSKGVVKIQVVEGELEKVEIQGLKRLKESYVRSRIGIPPNTPLNVRDLEKALQLLQLDPLFSRVQAELIAGIAPGRNVMMLSLVEVRPISSAVVVDNRDSPSVGSTGVTGIFSYNNLLGLGDRLGAEVGYTGGVNSYNLNYEVPVNSSNGTLSFRYNNGRNRVIEESFAPLNIKGRAQSYSLGFRQPINRSPNSEFALSLSADLRRSQTFLFDDEPFSFSPGAEEGESKVTAIRFSQDWTNRNSKRVLAARSQFSFGLGVLGATVNENEADGRFFSWVGQAQLVQALNERKDFVFVARAAAQLTLDSLLPLEQFSIGGVDTVRGYRTTQRLNDSGIVGSAELRFPIVRDLNGFGLIQLAPFIDVGTVWRNDDTTSDSGTLLSTGLGLRWQLGSRLSATIDWGIPLIAVERQGDSLQDNGINFSVRFAPF